MKRVFGIGFVLCCFVVVAVSNKAHAGCTDVKSQVELFKSLFVADEGPIRKWGQPIKIFITGEEEYVSISQKIFNHYADYYNINIEYVDEEMDVYLAITNSLYATLLSHGEIIFKGGYDDIEDLFAFLKGNAERDRGYVSKTRFRGTDPIASVMVVGTDYYDHKGMNYILNSIIVNALFPGVRDKTEENKNSAFFKAGDPSQTDPCVVKVMSQYYDERIVSGMPWEDVRRILEGERI